jgi:threonine synthase
MGVQAEYSNYLYEAWQKNEDVLTKPPIKPQTIADSISAGLPRDRLKAMAAVKDSGGAFISVTDDEILAAIPALAGKTGVFAEPAGAAALAGLVKAVNEGLVSPDERLVVINTGSGLKDVAGVMKGVDLAGIQPLRVEPALDSLRAVLAARQAKSE